MVQSGVYQKWASLTGYFNSGAVSLLISLSFSLSLLTLLIILSILVIYALCEKIEKWMNI